MLHISGYCEGAPFPDGNGSTLRHCCRKVRLLCNKDWPLVTTMAGRTVLITGCSRGIGLGLVKEFIAKQYNVIATCRDPEKAPELMLVLSSNGKPRPIACDVSCDQSIEACKNIVLSLVDRIDILINNAGISNKDHPDEPPSKMQRDEFLRIMSTNVAGPSLMTRVFLPLLLKSESPKVINISSGLGSIEIANNLSCISYRCSKSALNMLTKIFSIEFPNVTFVSIHPGWVQTDMGMSKNRKPPVTVAESASGIARVTENVGKENSGQFLDYRGEKIPF